MKRFQAREAFLRPSLILATGAGAMKPSQSCLFSRSTAAGPTLVREIKSGLVELLKRDGFTSVSQAVGADVPLPSASGPEPTEQVR